MKVSEKKALVAKALRALGINKGKVSIDVNDDIVGNVYVDDEFYGVFDYVKKTFID